MNKVLSLILMVLMPALASAHEGHIEGLLSGALHSFTMTEIVLAASAVVIWAITHNKDTKVKKVGALVALGMFGLSFGI